METDKQGESGTIEARQILEGISTVAAARRQKAQHDLNQPLPEWVLEIVQTEVVYTLNPRAFPLRSASFTALADLLEEKYSVKFARPTKNAILSRSDLSDGDVGTALLRADEGIRFEGGKFMRTTNDFDVVRSINLNFETIHVAVQGVSRVAELIIADVAEIVWASAGAQKRWDEIRPGVQLMGYGTSTHVDLGAPFENILSERCRDFFNNHMMTGERYALETGRRSARHSFEVSPSLSGIWALDDIAIKLFLFDQRTGRSEITRIDIGVTARDTMGTGRVRVYSELPFNKHVECVARLRESCLS